MKLRYKLYSLLLLLTFSTVTNAQSILPAEIEPAVGESYYTRYNFKFEKHKHSTTNYWVGEFVPLNSKVKLLSMDDKKFEIELDDGTKVKFVNKRKFTQRGIKKIASELLSNSEIPLSKVNPKFRDDLESGTLRIGMTKEEVLMTRGYPPRHKTPSTKSSRWIYWSSRFVQHTLAFENEKLARARGVY